MATVSCSQLAPVVGDLDGNRARAREAVRAAVTGGAGLDRAGSERGVDWVGATTIVDERGEILAGPVGDAAGTITAECDLPRARDKAWNERNDVFADRRPELYSPAETSPATR
ncbi:MAG TPA: hypothetical protein VHK22_00405 [Gaiellaceae bacterium]|jgi:predicted amidohydrolase|nr:hypothetical protein [Gaiellaceae bacterium]